jgi:hypothetical protein
MPWVQMLSWVVCGVVRRGGQRRLSDVNVMKRGFINIKKLPASLAGHQV